MDFEDAVNNWAREVINIKYNVMLKGEWESIVLDIARKAIKRYRKDNISKDDVIEVCWYCQSAWNVAFGIITDLVEYNDVTRHNKECDYAHVWSHQNLSYYFENGADAIDNSHDTLSTIECKTSRASEHVDAYFKQWYRSPLLEYIIMDFLVFAVTVKYGEAAKIEITKPYLIKKFLFINPYDEHRGKLQPILNNNANRKFLAYLCRYGIIVPIAVASYVLKMPLLAAIILVMALLIGASPRIIRYILYATGHGYWSSINYAKSKRDDDGRDDGMMKKYWQLCRLYKLFDGPVLNAGLIRTELYKIRENEVNFDNSLYVMADYISNVYVNSWSVEIN